jgi:hypothetical protein
LSAPKFSFLWLLKHNFETYISKPYVIRVKHVSLLRKERK